MKPLVIGIAGGSGSGKTTLVAHLCGEFGEDKLVVLEHDRYYREPVQSSGSQSDHINYDHPDSLETSLLIAHLEALIAGRPVDLPVYDFITHSRREWTEQVEPRELIVVEGILVLAHAGLRAVMDLRVFVDADSDVRFIRRLRRDTFERGRTVSSVIQQYLKSVRPMHLKYVEPSRQYADLVVPSADDGQALMTEIRSMQRKRISDGAH